MHQTTRLHARQNGADRPCPVDTGPAPMTTIFTPPASCAHRFTPYSGIWPTLIQQVYDTDCLPLGNNCAFYYGEHFSPGRCPSGYTTFSSSLGGAHTIATCCSSGFTWTLRSAGAAPDLTGIALPSDQCASSIQQKQTLTLTWDSTSTWTVTTTSASSTGATIMSSVQPAIVTTVISYGAMLMPPVYVTAKRGDFPDEESQSTGFPSTASSSMSSSASDEPATSGLPTQVPDTDRGLSTGAKAGIGVGVAVGVIVGVAGALLLWRRKRGNRSNTKTESAQAWTKPELGGVERQKPELAAYHGDMAHELPGDERARELP